MTTIDFSAAFGKALAPELADRLATILQPTVIEARDDCFITADGDRIPVINGVPRYVPSDQYVSSFSFQWAHYKTALHDEGHQSNHSQRDFDMKFGLTRDEVAGKLFLDAGCGTGRLSEILIGLGAYVVGVDLSNSVDIARQHLAGSDRVVVMQGDIGNLPFRPDSFDFVISTGVLHHTPDTRAYTEKLVPLVKPGGDLAIWVYHTRFRRRKGWIPLTSRLPHPAFHAWCTWIIDIARARPHDPLLGIVKSRVPFTIHHETAARSTLTLFDGYTPTYHGIHSEEEVIGWFRDFGLTDIRTNQVETSVRGHKPA